MKSRRPLCGLALAIALVGAAGCATTIDSSNTTAPAGSTTTTIFVPGGTISDVLSQLVDELTGLSEAIVDNHRQAEMMARADALWDAARPSIEASHPSLVGDFDDSMALAHNGVDRRRPADADKALNNLRALIAALPTADPSATAARS